MRPNSASFAIVGAGIAGLATAIAAARQGQHARLFDAAAPRGDGSVLLLWPNGMKAARALGLDTKIAEIGTDVRRTVFKLWNGSRLWELNVKSFERKYGARAVLISREDLIGVLVAAVPASMLPIVQAECVGFEDCGSTVSPRFTSAQDPGAHDALIGCDGIRSVIREQLRPSEGPLRSAYHSAWIGLSDATLAEWPYDVGHTVTFLGHGLRFCASTMKNEGHVAGSHRVYWYATEAVSGLGRQIGSSFSARDVLDLLTTAIERGMSQSRLIRILARASTVYPPLAVLASALAELQPEDFTPEHLVTLLATVDPTGEITAALIEFLVSRSRKALTDTQLVDLFATQRDDVAALIDRSRTNAILKPRRFPIHDRIPVRTWTKGRVTLAGDAAHPSTPDLGQGACQALESAAVFGRCLAESDDIFQVLRRYERKRIDRTARVTEMSRLTALQSMARTPFVETVRELGIRTMLPTITQLEFDSLFSTEF